MNKKQLGIIIGIVLLITLAIGYVILAQKDDTSTNGTPTTSRQENTNPQQATPTDTRTGVYVDYTDTIIADTAGTKVLFFHAPWCPQCREVEESINENGIPTGVTVIKVDYDSNQALRRQYDVTLQTTFVKIDDSGNKIASYVAYQEPQFSSVERELLK